MLLTAPNVVGAQPVQPFVDHWDSLKTVKKSEGLMVNGREWGEWKFWDRAGRLTEVSDFKAGERDGHVVIYYDNDQVQHNGWIHRGAQDSLMSSYYRTGHLMEQGHYADGAKQGPWSYHYPDGDTMLTEVCDKGTCLSLNAWPSDIEPSCRAASVNESASPWRWRPVRRS